MIPPAGFEPSPNFQGFHHPSNPSSMIMLMEIPGPFEEISKGFNSEMLRARGMELKEKNQIRLEEMDGYLIQLNQPANGMVFSKHILVYGNDSSTVLINGVYHQNDLDLGAQIKKSLLSLYRDQTIAADPRAALEYSIDESSSNLQLNSVMGKAMIFNRDKNLPTQSPDKATLITDQSFATLEISDRKAFCINRLTQYPDDFIWEERKEILPLQIDGLSGYGLHALSSEKDGDAAYQVILFEDEGGYYIFLGTYAPAYPKALADIQQAISTFRRK